MSPQKKQVGVKDKIEYDFKLDIVFWGIISKMGCSFFNTN